MDKGLSTSIHNRERHAGACHSVGTSWLRETIQCHHWCFWIGHQCGSLGRGPSTSIWIVFCWAVIPHFGEGDARTCSHIADFEILLGSCSVSSHHGPQPEYILPHGTTPHSTSCTLVWAHKFIHNDFQYRPEKTNVADSISRQPVGLYHVKSADIIFTQVVTMLTWHADVVWWHGVMTWQIRRHVRIVGAKLKTWLLNAWINEMRISSV